MGGICVCGPVSGSSPRGRGKPQRLTLSIYLLRLIPAWAGKTREAGSHEFDSQAHPRVGGENAGPSAAMINNRGSSPRGRGKLSTSARASARQRLIPAWAGKTSSSAANIWGLSAHPRVGGENLGDDDARRLEAGSSPRGRGKRAAQRRLFRGPGLIPAWAGKTAPSSVPSSWYSAHPRVGGENRVLRVTVIGLSRLIPAWAGKTGLFAPGLHGSAAHPRVGGENLATADSPSPCPGSSPRGRGKPLGLLYVVRRDRLIPAWAGKTARASGRAAALEAHPRVGGENDASSTTQTTGPGSSPRGRGKHLADVLTRITSRLIPAWAGKTGIRASMATKPGAHPRVGGENRVYRIQPNNATGSSPRGRGKRRGYYDASRAVGLIPAWAGKTRLPTYL